MKPRFVIALSLILAMLVGLVLLATILEQGVSERSAAAGFLILGFVVFAVGGVLFTGRAMWKWPIGQTPHFLLWERGLVITAVLATVLGLVLLQRSLETSGASAVSELALVTYTFGAVIVVDAETAYLGTQEWVYPQIVFYVVLAFLAQAAFGMALVQSELVAKWVGWFVIFWNLAWPLAFFIFRPRDLYFPALHHVAPLVIGIVLLAQG